MKKLRLFQILVITIITLPLLSSCLASTSSSGSSSIPVADADRVVLAEVFTGTWCGWCPYADRAIETLATEQGSNLAVLEYHVSDSHAVSDVSTKTNLYSISGYPTVIFDGTTTKAGANPDSGSGSDYEQLCYDAYSSTLTTRLAVGASVSITGEVTVASSIAAVSATVSNESSGTLSNFTINAVLYEDLNESEFRFVVRDILAPETVASLASGATETYSANSETLTGVDTSNIGVIVFVQSSSDNEVLNARGVTP